MTHASESYLCLYFNFNKNNYIQVWRVKVEYEDERVNYQSY